MRKLLNTLFVTQPDHYLSLDGDNVVLKKENQIVGRVPAHNLESIVTFGYTGASPALMGYCAKRNIGLVFLNQNGRFRARVIGSSQGNVILRKEQYRVSDDEVHSAEIARNFILGKVYNQRWILERMTRDHALRIDMERFKNITKKLAESLSAIRHCRDLDELRGIEGQAAVMYNSLFELVKESRT